MSESKGMTVRQLIEALSALPQDAQILTHANNHTTGLGTNNTQHVAEAEYEGAQVVVIGNWDGWNVGHWHGRIKPVSPVFFVRTWGEEAGELKRGRLVREPARTEQRTYEERIEERTRVEVE